MGENEAFGLFLIANGTANDQEVVLMTVAARCKKCGGPLFSMGLPSGNGLCLTCARMEAARKMSFMLE